MRSYWACLPPSFAPLGQMPCNFSWSKPKNLESYVCVGNSFRPVDCQLATLLVKHFVALRIYLDNERLEIVTRFGSFECALIRRDNST